MANKMKLSMNGFEDMLERIRKAGGSIEKAAEAALVEGAKPFQDDLKKGIIKHHRTGLTEKALQENEVKWEGNVATLEAGFKISKGGLPALFIEYGTPKQKADPFIRPAIESNTPKARRIQKQVLSKILEELEK
jgi:HK97 gp10 family phage protein